MKNFLLSISGLLLLNSCDFIKMPETTSQMNQTTLGMSQSTDELLAIMKNAYGDGRQAAIKVVMDAFKYMRESKSQAGRVALAAVFFKAWEYQLHRPGGEGKDDRAWKEMTAEEALAFFLRSVHEFGPAKEFNGNVIKPEIIMPIHTRNISVVFDQDSNAQSLKALAATMHLLNSKQKILKERDPEYKTASILDLLEDSLLGKIQPSDVELEEWEDVGLEWEETSLYLLNLRANFLQLLAVNEMSQGAFLKIGGLGTPQIINWTFKHPGYNSSKLKAVKKRLKEVKRVKEFLNKPKLRWSYSPDPVLQEIWQKMNPMTISSEKDAGRKALLQEINEYIKTL